LFYVDSMLQRFLETYFPREDTDLLFPVKPNTGKGFFYFFQNEHKYPTSTSLFIAAEPEVKQSKALVDHVNGMQTAFKLCLFSSPTNSWNVGDKLADLDSPFVLMRLGLDPTIKNRKLKSLECYIDFEFDTPNGIVMGIAFKPKAGLFPQHTSLSKRLDSLCSQSGKKSVFLFAAYQPVEELDDTLFPHIQQNVSLVKHVFLIDAPSQISGNWHEISLNSIKSRSNKQADPKKSNFQHVVITNTRVTVEKVCLHDVPRIPRSDKSVEDISWEIASRLSMVILSLLLFYVFQQVVSLSSK